MNRRTAIIALSVSAVSAATFFSPLGARFRFTNALAETQPLKGKQEPMNDSTTLDPNPATITPLELSKEQWRERLDEQAYYVLREEGTERPFTSPLNDEKSEGHFACKGCGLLLFTSAMKYNSGTGWPSFFDYIDGRLETKTDYKLILPRTEYHCARCGGHQGHVFKDGPKPTGLRYCNNGVALNFIAA